MFGPCFVLQYLVPTARNASVQYNHCMSPSVYLSLRILAVSENAHNSLTTWYILIKCIRMNVNLV